MTGPQGHTIYVALPCVGVILASVINRFLYAWKDLLTEYEVSTAL